MPRMPSDLQGSAKAPQVIYQYQSKTLRNLVFDLILNVFRFAEKTAGELEALRQQLLIVSS